MEQQIAHLLAPPHQNLTLARGGTQPVHHLDATAAIVGRQIPCRRLHLGDLCAGGGFPFRLQPPFQARFHQDPAEPARRGVVGQPVKGAVPVPPPGRLGRDPQRLRRDEARQHDDLAAALAPLGRLAAAGIGLLARPVCPGAREAGQPKDAGEPEPGRDEADERPHGGQAGGDDAGGHFNVGPGQQRRERVADVVLGVVEQDPGAERRGKHGAFFFTGQPTYTFMSWDAKREDSQEAQAKHQRQANLFQRLELQPPDLRDGQQQDDNLADAAALDGRPPQLLDGHADEGEEKGHAHGPEHDETAHGHDLPLEQGEPEDAVVHAQQAELGPAQVPHVDDFRDEQPHGDIGDGALAHLVGVVAHALDEHGEPDPDDGPVPDLFVPSALYVSLKNHGFKVVVPPEGLVANASTPQACHDGQAGQRRHPGDDKDEPFPLLSGLVLRHAGDVRALKFPHSLGHGVRRAMSWVMMGWEG
ncbi:hypothetical protein MAN_10327, partial [Metarhizium hybridum]